MIFDNSEEYTFDDICLHKLKSVGRYWWYMALSSVWPLSSLTIVTEKTEVGNDIYPNTKYTNILITIIMLS